MVSIVQVNVSVLQAPTPSTLQQTGALISQGGTTSAPNSLTLITQVPDLTAILTTPGALTNQTYDAGQGVVHVTTATAHGLTSGQSYAIDIASTVPTTYNGSFIVQVTGTTTFDYPMPSSPGSLTTTGTWAMHSRSELVQMATTFFAQGVAQSVYVLELGETSVTQGVSMLTTWIQNNPLSVYGFLVPRSWDANPNFLQLIASYEEPTGLLYFWVTTTVATYANYTDLMKCVIALIEAPSVDPSQNGLEFSLAASFYHALNYRPNSSNKVAPFAFSYTYGVTAYPTPNNGALLTNLKANAVNVISSGAEGGIQQNMILWGVTKDGRDYLYWYSVDYTQITGKQVLANEIINGSNIPTNPLYYDQNGINRLQARLAQMMSNEITYGLAVGSVLQTELGAPDFQSALNAESFSAQAVVNAEPFVIYSTENPSDYKIGRYAGLTVVYIPSRGFEQILLNIVVSDFITF